MAQILVVDSDPDYRSQLAFALEWSQHTVVTEPNGKDAIVRFREETFDVVITDIFMPEMDGLELMRVLRKISPGTKIIALSSNGLYGRHGYAVAVAKALGAVAVLDKTAPFPELNGVISKVLG